MNIPHLKYLITIANSLDEKGLYTEADYLDHVIKKIAEEPFRVHITRLEDLDNKINDDEEEDAFLVFEKDDG